MNNLLWLYEINHVRQGGFRLPTRGDWTSQSNMAGLAFFLPRGALQITGAPRSVFTVKPPKGFESALAAYQNKKNAEAKAALVSYLAKHPQADASPIEKPTSYGGGKRIIATGERRQTSVRGICRDMVDMATFLKLSGKAQHSEAELKELCRIAAIAASPLSLPRFGLVVQGAEQADGGGVSPVAFPLMTGVSPLPKLNVADSNPVSRSRRRLPVAWPIRARVGFRVRRPACVACSVVRPMGVIT